MPTSRSLELGINALLLDRLLEKLEPGQAIASMGYPDILHPTLEIPEGVKVREDSEEICQRHGVKGHPIPDAESLFEYFGVSLDVYDVVEERGGEIILDLNNPFPAQSREQYDYVLDAGTLEHCFNVSQAAKNMASLLKVGGTIFHENPWNWGNHGFYSLQPTWFFDFYEANGFEVESCFLVDRQNNTGDQMTPGRFVFHGAEVVLLTQAKRLAAQEFVHPHQRKYQ